MKRKIVKFLEFLAVIVALAIAVFVTKSISLEPLLRGKEEPVSLTMTKSGLPEDSIGMPAADDIPRIEDIQTWEDTWQTSYVTIEPIGIVSTGIGKRHAWIEAYTNSRKRGGTRKRAEATNMAFDILGEYGEYYLLQLPDESYILAQMPVDYARKIKAGQKVVLPIGRKEAANQQVLAKISDICQEYDVYTESVFYCINDKWNESHKLTLQLIRIGIGILITFVIGLILIIIIDRIFNKKHEQSS